MGKQRREQPQDSIFANNPFLDGLFEWMDSPEGQQSIEVRDVLWNLVEDVQLDAKQRKLIWPDAESLDLEQSIQHVQKKYPDFPRNEVEEFLLDWIDMGYDPENYSQAREFPATRCKAALCQIFQQSTRLSSPYRDVCTLAGGISSARQGRSA